MQQFVVAAVRLEAALLEHAARRAVVRRDRRVQRPLVELAEERGERGARDAVPPVLAADPVADLADAVLLPAHQVAGDLAVADDRAHEGFLVAADPLPLLVEGRALARGDAGHRARLRVALVLEEDRQVGVLDRAQPDVAQRR